MKLLSQFCEFQKWVYLIKTVFSKDLKISENAPNCSDILKTGGPKGPWVAHLRKRSKVTVEPFTEDH